MNIVKTAVIWVVIVIVVFLLWSLFQTTKPSMELVSFSAFLDRVSAGAVERVVIRGNELVAETRTAAPGGRRAFRTVVPASYPAMYDLMRSKGVDIQLEEAREAPLLTAIITWAPVLFLIGLWVFFMRWAVKRKGQSVNSQPPTTNR